MIAWVYDRARTSPLLDRLTLATDSDAILSYCRSHAIPAVRTSAQHRTGTSRLIEVLEEEARRDAAADVYVNIQGDEPMVTSHHIELLLKPFMEATLAGNSGSQLQPPTATAQRASPQDSKDVRVSTLKVAIDSAAAADPNAVKVVTDTQDRALYFSRARIPCDRDATGQARYYKHLGFYAYSAEALRRFSSLPCSPLEEIEQLEQLRFLESGIPITVIETSEDTIGVDTEEDLRRVEDYFRDTGIAQPETMNS